MLRLAGCCLLLAGLAGCASTTTQDTEEGDYFSDSSAQVLPNSPLDGPLLQSFLQPSPKVIRQALLEEHRRWVGTPYRLGGESEYGIDCSALVQAVFDESFDTHLPRTTQSQALQGHQIRREQLEAGDLVFFRPPGVYRHVGIYVGEGRFLHASSSQGVILSDMDNIYWRRHFWQARRPMEPTRLAQRAMLTRYSGS
ncbi:C40 family peptidase [Aidingimonas lacisalsi]|uniref:C40 family peptidase n=1 Tax=Aidingimonas lacisalsi TaxID=2604086 RepID=UPI0011D2C05B|nr:NlpC/P60 family protein [Aidingimonas lacisalsi]